MQKILICDDEVSIREILSMILETEFDNPIVQASGVDEAIEILKNDINIGLILCDYNMPKKNGAALFSYNQDARNIPFMMLTGDHVESFSDITNFKTNKANCILFKPWDENDLFETIRQVFAFDNDEALQDFEEVKITYRKIKTHTINKYHFSFDNTYIKKNELEYLKVDYNHQSPTDRAEFEDNNLFIYVEESEFKNFVSHINNYYENLIKSLNDVSKVLPLSEAVMDRLCLMFNNLSIESSEIETFSKTLEEQMEVFSENVELEKLIEKFRTNEDYLIGHSFITIFILLKLTKHLGYEQKKIQERFIQTALLHDLYIDNTEYSQYFTKQEIERSKLNQDSMLEVLNHPIVLAEHLKKNTTLDKDVIQAIAYHHELPNGKGYPKGLKADEISYFAAIFNVAQFAGDKLYKNGFSSQSIAKIKAQLEKDYLLGLYVEPAQALLAILNDV